MLAGFMLFSWLGTAIKGVKTKGVKNIETEYRFLQGIRANLSANLLLERGETHRAGRWYQLTIESCNSVLTDKAIDDSIRIRCLTTRIRAALLKEDYPSMEKYIKKFAKHAKKTGREDDLNFYRACLNYLYKNNDFDAANTFIQLKEKLILPQSPFDKAYNQMIRQPKYETGNAYYELLFGNQQRSFDNIELLYRFGECLEKRGRPADANAEWQEAALQYGSTFWKKKAEERLKK